MVQKITHFKPSIGHAMRLAILIVLAGLTSLHAQNDNSSLKEPKFSPEAAATFNKRCSACHTYGKGIKVGPDLKGVTERRTREWLLRFIRQSSSLIKAGDPIAGALFAQFQQQRMPDWTDLSQTQINDILDYLAVGGPEIKPLDERDAALAKPEEIEAGRNLFYGQARFEYGAKPCTGCHTISGPGFRGGTLGPDLTSVYFKFQDKALTLFLRRPCFQWDSAPPVRSYLTAKESFSLKAFLSQIAERRLPGATSSVAFRK
jgi:cytochrome c2